MTTALRGRSRALRQIGALTRTARLLVVSQLLFNIGFFLVLPHLVGHLADELGLAGWLIGLSPSGGCCWLRERHTWNGRRG